MTADLHSRATGTYIHLLLKHLTAKMQFHIT